MSWALRAGEGLAHYRVVSPLGSGGMAQVYLAEDVRLGRRRALKILSPRGARDDERLQRFQREARAVSALNHPNILTVYDVGHDPGMQFLATEYVDGITLRRARTRPARARSGPHHRRPNRARGGRRARRRRDSSTESSPTTVRAELIHRLF
jgi:serine/threonine protein kinase